MARRIGPCSPSSRRGPWRWCGSAAGRPSTQARIFGRVAGALTAAIYGPRSSIRCSRPACGGRCRCTSPIWPPSSTAYALWSQRHWAFALTYYWGLVLSVQALISPVLTGPDFPHLQFLGFWSIHLLVVWAAIYLTWGRGMRPGWRSYRFVVAATLAWVAVTMTFNSIAGTDYGFLNGKPGHTLVAGRVRAVAVVPGGRGHSGGGGVGGDDLAVGTRRAEVRLAGRRNALRPTEPYSCRRPSGPAHPSSWGIRARDVPSDSGGRA